MLEQKIGAGTACLAGYGFWEALDRLQSLGFRSVEILGVEGSRHSLGALPGRWLDELSTEEFARLNRALAGFEHKSAHAPFVDAPLFTYNRRIARASFRQVSACIEAAGRLGMSAVAVHANPRHFLQPRDYWDEMRGVYRQLGDIAREAGVVVGVETGYPNHYEEFLDLIREIDHPAVGATVDVGHVAFLVESGPRGTDEGVANYRRCLGSLCGELGERLVHTHIHDVRKADWRDHRTPGTGVIDFPALFAALKKVGYDGLLQLELEEEDREGALLESKHYLAELVAAA